MADQRQFESEESAGGLVAIYTREIAAAKKELEKFKRRGGEVDKLYKDDRGSRSSGHRYNLFWSNVNVLKSSLYARQPKADVSRRNKDPSDDVGRVAGEMIERILNLDMDSQTSDIDLALRQCVEDRLIPGMGQVWVRYEPTFVKEKNPDYIEGALDVKGEPMLPEVEVIGDERAPTDYVHWDDFLYSPCRTWRECRWVARGIYLTRDGLVKKFGKELGALVPLGATKGRTGTSISDNDPWQKALVWEIWNKDHRKVCWFVEGFDQMLGEEDDPLKLQDFFPCPMPLLANTTTSALVAKADYDMLLDQYQELDDICSRIALLEEAIRVVGVYDKKTPELGGMLKSGGNKMISADNWAMFAEKGGIKGSIDWFPIDMVVEAINRLREAKAAHVHDIYELTGISDIQRGASVASETATAQQLKAQFGSVRQQFLQGSLATFVQQTLSIKAEIIAAHFQPQTIIRQSMVEFSPDRDLALQAVQRLKDKRLAYYSLQVDPDTMASVDYAAEQAARTACIQAIGAFLTSAMPLIQMKPEAMPFLLQILQWYLASFKAGKTIEGVLDQAVRAITQAGPQPPSPEQQAQLRKTQSEAVENEASAAEKMAGAKTKPMLAAVEVMSKAQGIAQGIAQPGGAQGGLPGMPGGLPGGGGT